MLDEEQYSLLRGWLFGLSSRPRPRVDELHKNFHYPLKNFSYFIHTSENGRKRNFKEMDFSKKVEKGDYVLLLKASFPLLVIKNAFLYL